jgi:hypothetical protein
LATPTQTQTAEISAKSNATAQPTFFEKLSSRKVDREETVFDAAAVFLVMAWS